MRASRDSRADVALLVGSVILLPLLTTLSEGARAIALPCFLFNDFVFLYPHFAATLLPALGRGGWDRRAPLLLIAGLIASGVVLAWGRWTGLLIQLRFYAGMAHSGQQQAWILYCRRNTTGRKAFLRYLLETAALALASVALIQRRLGGYTLPLGYGSHIHIPLLSAGIQTVLEVATWGSVAVMSAWLGLELWMGRGTFFEVLLCGTYGAAFLYVVLVPKEPLGVLNAYYLGLVGWHCFQYLAWIGLRKHGLPTEAGRRWVVGWGGLVGCGAVLWFLGKWVGLGFIMVLALVHFTLDAVIWPPIGGEGLKA